MSDQLAVDTVSEVLEAATAGSGKKLRAAAEAAARRLVDLARDAGSGDDVSVIVNAYDWAAFA